MNQPKRPPFARIKIDALKEQYPEKADQIEARYAKYLADDTPSDDIEFIQLTKASLGLK